MRITIKIASSGASRLHRFPVAKYSIDECKNADKGLDLAKVRQALAVDGVQTGAKDDMPVLAFALAAAMYFALVSIIPMFRFLFGHKEQE